MVSSPGRRGTRHRTWVQVVAIVAVAAVLLSFIAGVIGALL
jgi:preprotein translocase subunit SecE